MAQPPILSLEGIALQQGGKWLFGGPDHEPLDLHVGPRDRIALIGRNGVGKTTLFRMIDGVIETDSQGREMGLNRMEEVLIETCEKNLGRVPLEPMEWTPGMLA